jgi:excisionase family DNA binding protein
MDRHDTTDPTLAQSLLTAKQLAARWAVSPQLIYHLAETRRLPHYRIGTSLRFRLTDVEAYEAAHRQEALCRPVRLVTRARCSQGDGTHGR